MCSSDTAPTTVPSGCLFSIIIFPYLPANVIIIPVVWNSCSRGSVLDLSFRGCLRFELGLLHGRTIWIGPFKKAHLQGSIWKENQTQIDPRRKKDPSNISFILWWIKHLPCIICNRFCASLFTSLQIITTVCCECYRVNINSSETAIFDFYFSVLVVSTTSPLFTYNRECVVIVIDYIYDVSTLSQHQRNVLAKFSSPFTFPTTCGEYKSCIYEMPNDKLIKNSFLVDFSSIRSWHFQPFYLIEKIDEQGE